MTTILTYVNVSPMLVMGELGFDRGGYSSVMAGTALVSMITSFSAPLALSYFKQRTLMLISQTLLVSAAMVIGFAHLNQWGIPFYLFGFGMICAGFSIGFGVVMSQALSPFSLHAGVASSLLGIAQVCCSALYIWFMGFIGVNALNMLVFMLAIGGVISLSLILFIPMPAHESHYEEVTSSS